MRDGVDKQVKDHLQVQMQQALFDHSCCQTLSFQTLRPNAGVLGLKQRKVRQSEEE